MESIPAKDTRCFLKTLFPINKIESSFYNGLSILIFLAIYLSLSLSLHSTSQHCRILCAQDIVSRLFCSINLISITIRLGFSSRPTRFTQYSHMHAHCRFQGRFTILYIWHIPNTSTMKNFAHMHNNTHTHLT